MSVRLKSRFPQIERELRSRDDNIARRAAGLVSRAAKERVPVETGRLRAAIHIEQAGPATFEVIAGNDEAFYGHIVEHGGVNTPPHPFLVPALKESRVPAIHMAQAMLRNL